MIDIEKEATDIASGINKNADAWWHGIDEIVFLCQRIRDEERARVKELIEAAEKLITQFRVIKMNQQRLLVRGQDLESASENWEEAAGNQSFDLGPLVEALDRLNPKEAMPTKEG